MNFPLPQKGHGICITAFFAPKTEKRTRPEIGLMGAQNITETFTAPTHANLGGTRRILTNFFFPAKKELGWIELPDVSKSF